MSIGKERAIFLAREFAETGFRKKKTQLRLGSANALLETGGFGHERLGLGISYWSVLFQLLNADSSIATMDPDHVIVLVDAQSETTVWFPLM